MENIKEYYSSKKEKLKLLAKDKNLKLVIVQVGNNEASNRYVRNKIKDANDCNILTELIRFDSSIDEKSLIEEIKNISNRKDISGFILQLPLPKNFNEKTILAEINPDKDVDGLSLSPKVNPATPQGIVTYLKDNSYDFKDKNVLIIGRSDLVGKPLANMLLKENCNVTIVHSKTSLDNKIKYLSLADLIICATGYRNTLMDDMLKNTNKKAFIIDVGINFNENNKLVGDCENVSVIAKTPVPGGVGLLTRLAVIENILRLNCIL